MQRAGDSKRLRSILIIYGTASRLNKSGNLCMIHRSRRVIWLSLAHKVRSWIAIFYPSAQPDDREAHYPRAFVTQADGLVATATHSPRQYATEIVDVMLHAFDEEIPRPTQKSFDKLSAGVVIQDTWNTTDPEWHRTCNLAMERPVPNLGMSESLTRPSKPMEDGSFQTTTWCGRSYSQRQQYEAHPSPKHHRGTMSKTLKDTPALTRSILPSSTRDGASRARIVLNYPVPDWLMGMLKRKKAVRYLKRLSDTPSRLETAIGALLSQPNAIWRLTMLTIPWTTSSTSPASSIPHESSHDPSKIPVYGQVLHADFVYSKKMSFRLTEATVDAFWNACKSLDIFANTEEGREGAFRASLRMYIPIMSVRAFWGLQQRGSGEIQDRYAEQVKREMEEKLRQAIRYASRVG